VSHDYERYANLWDTGLTPYYKHFYEYPPATLPLLYFPLKVDQLGIGQYYQNYRVQVFLVELIFFWFIAHTINRLKMKPANKWLSLCFYLLAPVVAKDFYYEGLDVIFIGSLSLGIISLLNKSKEWLGKIWFWTFFWLSTGVKFLTAPLFLPFFYLKKLSFWEEVKAATVGFLLIWGLPLAYFRSSLAVMFVFHAKRGLKYASFPSFVVETINYWTQTEVRFPEPPDFQLMGPVSTIAEKVVGIVFPLAIALTLGYAIYKIFKSKPEAYSFALKISLIFILTIFLTGKVFSQPFHLWLIPLVVLFPFKSINFQLKFLLPVLWLLIIDTTPWINIAENIMVIEPLPSKFFIYLARFIPMFWLLIMAFKLPDKLDLKST
jgi:hypothetical protein